MQAYVLRAEKIPQGAEFPAQSIIAWNVEPDSSIAPAQDWELVADLEAALAAAPALQRILPEPPPPYVPPAPSPEQVVQARIKAAMEFGAQLMIEYGARNVLAGRSTADILAISAKLATVQQLLQSGSLYAALSAINALTPDALVTEVTINEFKGKIQTYLGV